MPSSLSTLLAQLPADAGKKGREFERLVKWFLENEPTYKAQLRKVHHWSTSPHRWGRDAGIDLTAEDREGRLWAIQAKCYDVDYSIKKSDVDSFLSESGRRPSTRIPFDLRLLIATTDKLGANARKVLAETPGARCLLRADLEKCSIEWPASFAQLRPARVQPARPKPYQTIAIGDIVAGFKQHSRGQLIMACGTGKTLTALWAVEQLRARRVLVLLPSLSLVRQTLASWYTHGKRAPPYKVVCSDESVHRGEDGDALVARARELPYPVTTDPEEIASFLSGDGPRYVFSTYHSSPQIAAAYRMRRTLPPLDLIVADEAHRIAGAPDAAFATVLDDDAIKSKRRVFMTATPRYATGRLLSQAKDAEIEIASMDNTAQFGPVFHRLSFADALDQQLLTDYQVAIVVVDNETALEDAERGAFASINGKRVDARTVASQLGLARAMRKYDLHKVVSFHSRVSWAASYALSFPEVVERMRRELRPSGTLWCRHVSGAQSTHERDIELNALKELDADSRGLLANARCLTEGIDVPALDGVAVVDPRRSEVDVVQAVGRAIRKTVDKKVGTIVIPVFVGKRADAVRSLESSAFKPVWQVIQALRAHDEVLAAQLDELRRNVGRRGTTGRLPAKIKVVGATELGQGFFDAFDTQLVEQTTASWEFWFGLLEAFVKGEGHALVPQAYCVGAHRLGTWVNKQRQKRNQLSKDRYDRLAALPRWSWEPKDELWQDAFESLKAFVQREGHARVPQGYRAAYVSRSHETFDLNQWMRNQRARKHVLSSEQVDRLSALRGWSWDLGSERYRTMLDGLRGYAAQYGLEHLRRETVFKGLKLGEWTSNRRADHKKGKLEQWVAEELAALPGWSWDPKDDAHRRNLGLLRDFVAKHGWNKFNSRTKYKGVRLGSWVDGCRGRNPPPWLRAELEALAGWSWDPFEDAFSRSLEIVRRYVAKNGWTHVTQTTRSEGLNIGTWIGSRRAEYRSKKPALTPARQSAVETIPGWTWEGRENLEEKGHRDKIAALRDFVATHGWSELRGKTVYKGLGIGAYVNTRRVKWNAGKPEKYQWVRSELCKIPGWTWSAR